MKIEVINIKGKSTGRELKLSKDVFGIVDLSKVDFLVKVGLLPSSPPLNAGSV